MTQEKGPCGFNETLFIVDMTNRGIGSLIHIVIIFTLIMIVHKDYIRFI